MCLAIPAKIISLDGVKATVDMMGNQTVVDVSVIANVTVGDYIMVHAGFAIQKYTKEDAEANLQLIKEMVEKSDDAASV